MSGIEDMTVAECRSLGKDIYAMLCAGIVDEDDIYAQLDDYPEEVAEAFYECQDQEGM